MSLTLEPEIVDRPEMHYVFVEKIGPFMNTAPGASDEAHNLAPAVLEHNEITGYMSLYKMGPPNLYRAGFALAVAPRHLPDGLAYENSGRQISPVRSHRLLSPVAAGVRPRVGYGRHQEHSG